MKTLIFFVSTIVLVSALSKSWEEVWNKGQQNLEANFRVVYFRIRLSSKAKCSTRNQLLKLDFMFNLLFQHSFEPAQEVHEFHMVRSPGNALVRVQWVHEPADLWDITFCTR